MLDLNLMSPVNHSDVDEYTRAWLRIAVAISLIDQQTQSIKSLKPGGDSDKNN